MTPVEAASLEVVSLRNGALLVSGIGMTPVEAAPLAL